jgi:hypothetical protein
MMLGIQKTAVQSDSMTDNEKLDAAEALVNKSSRGLSRGASFLVWAAATLVVAIIADALGAAPAVVTSLGWLFGLLLSCMVGEAVRSAYLTRKATRILRSV